MLPGLSLCLSLGKFPEIFTMPVNSQTDFLVVAIIFQNQTLIAIKAPQASYIEVTEPDEVGNMDGWGSKFMQCDSI